MLNEATVQPTECRIIVGRFPIDAPPTRAARRPDEGRGVVISLAAIRRSRGIVVPADRDFPPFHSRPGRR
jgi:hypothetical protein